MPKPARVSAPAPRSTAKSPTTPTAVARIQSAVAIQKGGSIQKGSYVGRMQQVAAKAAK